MKAWERKPSASICVSPRSARTSAVRSRISRPGLRSTAGAGRSSGTAIPSPDGPCVQPGIEKLEADVAAGRVGTVVVWRVDRLGRTAAGMLTFLEQLDAQGVKFVAVRDGFDSETPAGRLVRGVLAQVAAYEREVISERIRAGVAKAKAEGKRWGGRKPGQRTRLTDEKLSAMQALLGSGAKKAAIARQLGISERSVYRAIELFK